MTLPAAPSPLMQSVQYQDQTYYPSQYFHQQYLANSQRAGKHSRYDSFMRLLAWAPTEDASATTTIEKVRLWNLL